MPFSHRNWPLSTGRITTPGWALAGCGAVGATVVTVTVTASTAIAPDSSKDISTLSPSSYKLPWSIESSPTESSSSIPSSKALIAPICRHGLNVDLDNHYLLGQSDLCTVPYQTRAVVVPQFALTQKTTAVTPSCLSVIFTRLAEDPALQWLQTDKSGASLVLCGGDIFDQRSRVSGLS